MNSENKAELTISNPSEVFMATIFSGEGHASKDSGLLIALSTDGVLFHNIHSNSQPIYAPASGVRDPIILYRQGQWYLVYSYGPNVSKLLFLAKSFDLLHWTPISSLRLAEDIPDNINNVPQQFLNSKIIDVPQWIIDHSGNVHIIACLDNCHHWVEIHPLSSDVTTWGDQANWSEITPITDNNGEVLVQGNSFVALRNGTYYMVFNGLDATVYYMRTSSCLTSGWSEARQLNLENIVNNGDSENLVFLSDGSMRYYISNGNYLKHVMWYVDSADLGMTWTSPKEVKFEGFDQQKINWAEIVRITDSAAIAAIVAANQVSGMTYEQLNKNISGAIHPFWQIRY